MKSFDVAMIGSGAASERAEKTLVGKNVLQVNSPAEFLDEHTLRVGEETVCAEKFLIATGLIPHIPRIRGLDAVPHSVLPTAPMDSDSHLIIGGGHAGVMQAQKLLAKKRALTLAVLSDRILPTEDVDVSAFYHALLVRQGAKILLQTDIVQARQLDDKKIEATLQQNENLVTIEVDQLVLAAGVRPNTRGLHLERAGVYVGPDEGIVVNDEMRTSAPHVWAVGGVTGRPYLISLEREQAEIAAHNMYAFFFDKRRLEQESLPETWALAPALARVGLNEDEARANKKHVQVIKQNFGDASNGLVKIIARKGGGEILGAHIACDGAAELILYFDLAIRAGHSVYDLAAERHFPAGTAGEQIFQALRQF